VGGVGAPDRGAQPVRARVGEEAEHRLLRVGRLGHSTPSTISRPARRRRCPGRRYIVVYRFWRWRRRADIEGPAAAGLIRVNPARRVWTKRMLEERASNARGALTPSGAKLLDDRTEPGRRFMPAIENRPFDSLQVGEEARLVHTLTPEDFSLLATQAATIGAGIVDPTVL